MNLIRPRARYVGDDMVDSGWQDRMAWHCNLQKQRNVHCPNLYRVNLHQNASTGRVHQAASLLKRLSPCISPNSAPHGVTSERRNLLIYLLNLVFESGLDLNVESQTMGFLRGGLKFEVHHLIA